jgi:hypothetical protein
MPRQHPQRKIQYSLFNAGRFLEDINISELKDLWQTIKVYKIK